MIRAGLVARSLMSQDPLWKSLSVPVFLQNFEKSSTALGISVVLASLLCGGEGVTAEHFVVLLVNQSLAMHIN
jgi:hypothetical protein